MKKETTMSFERRISCHFAFSFICLVPSRGNEGMARHGSLNSL